MTFFNWIIFTSGRSLDRTVLLVSKIPCLTRHAAAVERALLVEAIPSPISLVTSRVYEAARLDGLPRRDRRQPHGRGWLPDYNLYWSCK